MSTTRELTVQQVLRDIEHVLGDAQMTIGDPIQLLNEAGEYLPTAHDWFWLQRRAVVLAVRGTITISDGTWTESTNTLGSTGAFEDYVFVQGDVLEVTGGTNAVPGFYTVLSRTSDDAIVLDSSLSSTGGDLATGDISVTFELASTTLPDDFAEVIALTGKDAVNILVQMTGLQELLFLKTNRTEESGYFYGAIVYGHNDTTMGGPPIPLLDLWPDPSASDADQFVMYYRASWKDVDDDTQLISIPPYMHTCYRQLVRAFARGYEDDIETTLAQELALWEASPFTMRAKERDGAQQHHYGHLEQGAADLQFAGSAIITNIPISGPS